MNRTTETLQSNYAKRFLLTCGVVALTAAVLQLIWIGKAGGHLLVAIGVAIVGGYATFWCAADLCRRRKQLKQMSVLHEHGPYDRREYVPPHEAGRQLGGNGGPNMWA
jgi:Flp pilus assembly protein TadB